jgi:hypothetical protein
LQPNVVAEANRVVSDAHNTSELAQNIATEVKCVAEEATNIEDDARRRAECLMNVGGSSGLGFETHEVASRIKGFVGSLETIS